MKRCVEPKFFLVAMECEDIISASGGLDYEVRPDEDGDKWGSIYPEIPLGGSD